MPGSTSTILTLLLRDDVLEDPRPLYAELRREAPVWQLPGQDTFVVSDPTLVRDAVRRTEDFSSNLVSLLHNDGTGRPTPYEMAPFRDPINVLSTADPPDHTAHRNLLQPALSPGALAELEPKVREIVAEQFAPILAAARWRPRADVQRGRAGPHHLHHHRHPRRAKHHG